VKKKIGLGGSKGKHDKSKRKWPPGPGRGAGKEKKKEGKKSPTPNPGIEPTSFINHIQNYKKDTRLMGGQGIP
jgi:hypothetical protein